MASNPTAQPKSASKPRPNRRSNRQRTRKQRIKTGDRSISLLIYLVRLIVGGLGASTIAGTVISVINPPQQQQQLTASIESSPAPAKPLPLINQIQLSQAIPDLTNRLQSIGQQERKLDASYLFVNPDTGEYSALGADRVLPAASTIKLPILIALFQDIDRQQVQLEEQLTIDEKSLAGGSGDLQEQKSGTQVSILVAATKMMTISDNTATNLIINRLGGQAALNQRFRNWGLGVTTINRPLPDLEGKNVTSATELARSILAIDRGKIVSDASRSQILSMMSNTLRNTMLPKGLGKDAKIAHKTGDIRALVADVGAIDLPSGKNYIAAVLVKRPPNDPAAPALIRKLSKIAYQYFDQPTTTLKSPPTPAYTPTPGFPNTVFIKKN